jgi:glycosyltransferase involved in cell wall biosynthesis
VTKAALGNRVLMLLENAPYLLDRRVYPESRALTSAGYRVSVICPGLPKERLLETIDEVRVYRYPIIFMASGAIGYLFEYGYAFVATFILSIVVFFREGFDVVHAHNPPDMFVFIAAIYRLFGKRFIYDQHDLAPEMYTAIFQKGKDRIYWLLVRLQQLSCRLADGVIVTNHSYRQVTLERSGISPQRVSIVRNGPDSNILKAVEPDATLRRAGKVTLGYVGAMGAHDGLDYLLRTLQHLRVDLNRTDFFCILVGWGSAGGGLKQLVNELNLSDFVSLTGWVDPKDVGRYLSSIDICIAPEPSNEYNDRCTVIKIAEYMAMGKPVVAFDLPEHRVTAQAAAVYARPNDTLDLASHIAALMDDDQKRMEMGRIGKERVETELAWKHQARYLLDVYQSLGMVPKTKVVATA